MGLFPKWTAQAEPREELGALLLTPNATSNKPENFANDIWETADIACELLGKAKCVERIRALAASYGAPIHAAACDFLRAQLKEECTSR